VRRDVRYFYSLSKNDLIKAVVIIGAPDSKGREEYIEFFHQALTLGKDSNFIHKMLNVVSQIILKIMEMDKIVVHAKSGKVLSYFLNIGLVRDYSIFAYNTVIQNPCVEVGMAPTGGSAYFLSKILGRSKAYEILISDKDITAQKAFKLGIVDKIVPGNKLEETALETAKHL